MITMKNYGIAVLFVLMVSTLQAQELFSKRNYTRQDTLRGTITKERAWWDLQKYELSVSVNPTTKSIKGTNIVHYKVLEDYNVMQIDLQNPMNIDKVMQGKQTLDVKRDGNAHFITLPKQTVGSMGTITIEFSGNPTVAKMHPGMVASPGQRIQAERILWLPRVRVLVQACGGLAKITCMMSRKMA
jgi:hypothetical protein